RILGSNLFAKDIPIELLCELSWLNFDAVNFAGEADTENFRDLMSLCDSAGIYYSISPTEVMQYVYLFGDSIYSCWFRYSDSLLTSDHCFARSNVDYDSIEQYTTAESLYYESDSISIRRTVVDILAYTTIGHDFLWFYEVYDEAPAQQWRHAVEDALPWNDYIPNVYTQDTLDCGDLSLEEVETSGIFSIQKHYAENNEVNEVTFTLNFGLLHTIDQNDYTGLEGDIAYGTMTDQARSVRAMMEAKYQPPPENGEIPDTLGNAPDFIMFDYYSFRQINPQAATAEMCDDDWLFLIDHFEEGIDSTVIPAHEFDVPVFFFPQTFGVAGGSVLYDTSGTLAYHSYMHRKPAPQEFRMLCNLALFHQAKGIFPYNLTSYLSPYGGGEPSYRIMSSLLDLHNIPFDAPYEEWVYTGRWSDEDFEYVRPDSLPPWIDGYDPLYSVASPPDTSGSVQKRYELWFEWLCEPYADLYNNLGGILADVKWIGPEMHDLWWCSGDYSNGADISYDGITPGEFVTPVIKVFEDSAQATCYLFYVDRYCISNDNPYEITFSPNDLPGYADCTTRLLDHSRRFIMDGTYSSRETLYTFLDTLDAGEGRLVELIDLDGGLPADVRITSSDVRMLQESDTLVHMETTVGYSVDIYAAFYNMGTASRDSVFVTLYDSTDSDLIGSDTLEFDGLGYLLPDSCRSCDRSTASFSWTPDSTDIGVHRLTAAAATWHGEPDSNDNSVDFVFVVNPRDYATEERDDPWDMTEGGNNDWNTNDIEAIALNWSDTSWTDSVSGMFEGVVDYDTSIGWFKGSISLAIREDSTEYIDTDRYHMLSFGIVANNPNTTGDNACAMHIKWIDSADTSPYGWVNLLSEHGYHVGNGWDRWATVGPINLNNIHGLHWSDDSLFVKELWILMQGSGTSIDPPAPVDIRIGWIRLEESAP
ncbi:MAG: hypothetical protein KAR44_09885, partial [Candidatus Aegiribacteria sp.]|nr:hypothetical protein [Candidatus Aegiribacteria sp.]